MNTSALIAANAARWSKAVLTRTTEFSAVSKRLMLGKARYQAIEAKTGVPWYVVAVIHEREAGGAWTANIANGQPFNRRTTLVPAGRGPFVSFEDAAIDALASCAPYAAHWTNWTPGGILTLLEEYNGLGYFEKGAPSPYVWSGTNQYTKGKYVRDHVYDPNVMDSQLGCAGLLLAMMDLDPTIKLDGTAMAHSEPLVPQAPKPPSDPYTSTGNVLNKLYVAVQGLLKKKA